jgi:NADH:ubiquinone oxidoreductase subunit E
MMILNMRGVIELSSEGGEIARPPSAAQVKKRSSKQKEREKKRLNKLLEKKAKQSKMMEILQNLQRHTIKEEDYAKMHSAKTLGAPQKSREVRA